MGSEKVRDRDHASQSATQAAPPRHPPRRSHPARPAVGTLTEQGAVTECEHHGYRRDRADPDACNQASEEAWRTRSPAPLHSPEYAPVGTRHHLTGSALARTVDSFAHAWIFHALLTRQLVAISAQLIDLNSIRASSSSADLVGMPAR